MSDFPTIEAAGPLVAAALGVSTATAHEAAGRIGALPSIIKPVDTDMTICGSAFPVKCPPGDNLFLHHAIYAAGRGDVLVIDCGDAAEYGYWGEVMAVAAQAVGLTGLVTTGGVRDAARFGLLGFPVFAGNICIRGTGKNPAGLGSLGEPVTIGDTVVHRGDIVLGDRDGVMILPKSRAMSIIEKSRSRDDEEAAIFERLKAGETSMAIYGLPDIAARSA